MTTIYAYYCKNGYPNELQNCIDSAAELIAGNKITNYYDISDILGTIDMWAFWEGFKACLDI